MMMMMMMIDPQFGHPKTTQHNRPGRPWARHPQSDSPPRAWSWAPGRLSPGEKARSAVDMIPLDMWHVHIYIYL